MSRRTLKRALDILAMFCGAIGLVGCGDSKPPVAFIPTPVSCVPESLGAPPAYPDTDEALRAAPTADRRYQLILAGRELRIARAGEVEPVVAGCRQ